MIKRTLAWMFCLAASMAQAQMLQPGMWELTLSNMNVDGKQLPDMQLILGQLQNQPSEKRSSMEQKMQKLAVTLGGT
ncbi:DUF3617 family protein, partial [Pseudomonas syringae]